MRSEKGITLMMLVITIIITLMIAVSAAYSGVSTYKGMKVKTFSEQLSIIKERVNITKTKAQTNSEIDLKSLGKEITEENLGRDLFTKVKNAVVNSKEEIDIENLRYFDSNLLKQELGVDIDNMEILINFENSLIISVNGVEYENQKVYTQKQIDEINK
ncbi:MAG: hypothetical protein HFJ43_03880 [Clostridia bacterium]|nr:hypothetical protein [Clostridia bacterium]